MKLQIINTTRQQILAKNEEEHQTTIEINSKENAKTTLTS